MEALAGRSLRELGREVSAAAADRGVTFGEDEDAFLIDPVPRVLTAEAWSELEAGLVQRVRALDAFVTDVYGARRIVAEGVVPARGRERGLLRAALAGSAPGGPSRSPGLDVVRDHEGRFRVLEDNVRTPSGIAYAVAARELMRRACPNRPRAARDRRRLRAAVRRAARGCARRAGGATLARGPQRRAREHRVVGALRDRGAARGCRSSSSATSTSPATGSTHGSRAPAARRRRLPAHERGPPDRVRRAARRASARCCTSRGAAGRSGWSMASAPAWPTTSSPMPTWRTWSASTSGRSRSCAPCTPTTSPSPRCSRRCSARVDELVIKPRDGSGGHGILVGPHADDGDRATTLAELRSDPEGYVAQEMVRLSRHPTVVDDRLEPRHVDLRAFVFLAGEHAAVLAGGLTRVALDAGALVVNSSQNGGAKDTWVLA